MKKINLASLAFSLILITSLALGTACDLLPVPGIVVSAPAGAVADSDNAGIIHTDWSVSPAESQSAALPSMADVVAKVKPAVVAINTEATINIFRRTITQQGAGSGWIIDESGIIVTNNHVVAGAQSISVTLDDGRTFTVSPKEVAADPLNDVAVLKIGAQDLPAADIGDSSVLRVGDWLLALGNPLGLGVSAKEGIVSRLDVSLTAEGQTLDDLIETSAAINPGASGGPLVNMKGEVIGITSVKISSIGVEGLGYAISINGAIPIIEELIKSAQWSVSG